MSATKKNHQSVPAGGLSYCEVPICRRVWLLLRVWISTLEATTALRCAGARRFAACRRYWGESHGSDPFEMKGSVKMLCELERKGPDVPSDSGTPAVSTAFSAFDRPFLILNSSIT